MATIDEIKKQADAIKNATQVGENTAVRVGGVLVDLANVVGNNKTSTDSVLVKKADSATMTTELGKKFDKENVVQSTGTSEDKVMSQKAVCDIAENLSDNISSVDLFFKDDIFNIKDCGRNTENGKLFKSTKLRTTTLIRLCNIKNYDTNGIYFSNGLFRGGVFGVAFFFKEDGSFIGYNDSTTVYSNKTPFPASLIPKDSYFVSFQQYSSNGNFDKVLLKDYHFSQINSNNVLIVNEIKRATAKEAELEDNVTNSNSTLTNKLENVSENLNDRINEISGGHFEKKYTSSSPEYKIGKTINTLNLNVGDTVSISNTDKNNGIFILNVSYGNICNSRTRQDNSSSIIIADENMKVLALYKSGMTTNVKNTTVLEKNAKFLIIQHKGTDEYNDSLIYANLTRKYIGIPYKIYNLIDGNFATSSFFNFRDGIDYTKNSDEIVIDNVTKAGENISKITDTIQGHKYYFAISICSSEQKDRVGIVIKNDDLIWVNHPGDNEYHLLSVVMYSTSNIMNIRALQTDKEGKRNIKIKYATFVDLTECFGEGYEPDISVMDHLMEKLSNKYIDGETTLKYLSVNDLYNNEVEFSDIKSELGMSKTSDDIVVSPNMSILAFVKALNNAMLDYENVCQCFKESFLVIDTSTTDWEAVKKIVNCNFRKDIFKEGKSLSQSCVDINNNLKQSILRFKDAKIGSKKNFSLNTKFQGDEPSAIVSEDGTTLFIYAHLKRISTRDGITWSEPISTPLSGDVTYVMHNNVNLIEGTYYLIGCPSLKGGGLFLYTSVDGINFTQRGKLFNSEAEIQKGKSVKMWGNTYLIKEYGEDKWYLYVEAAVGDETWTINMVTYTDLFNKNDDGTIGDATIYEGNPIIARPFNFDGVKYRKASSSAGNPDFAKGMDNRPIRVDGYYYMYYHSTFNGYTNILRAKSKDLKTWETEGICLDIRDTPTAGEMAPGNADHCVVEFKGRTYMFYSWDINNSDARPYIKYTVDDRPFSELLKLKP